MRSSCKFVTYTKVSYKLSHTRLKLSKHFEFDIWFYCGYCDDRICGTTKAI